MRCANPAGRHIAWNNGGIRRRADKIARKYAAEQFIAPARDLTVDYSESQ